MSVSLATNLQGWIMRPPLTVFVGLLLFWALTGCGSDAAPVDHAALARRWVDEEFQPSTLSRDEQLAEMRWFTAAAEPFRDLTINVVSETIDTHAYESSTLAKAFTDITGIEVAHDLIPDGVVFEKLQTQVQSGLKIYDSYVNAS